MNLPPEPVSNLPVSLGEDVAAVVLLALSLFLLPLAALLALLMPV